MSRTSWQRWRAAARGWLTACAVACSWSSGLPALACPGVLSHSDLPLLGVAPRRSLRLFVLRGAPQRPVWEAAALQVDPLGSDGRLQFFNDQDFLRAASAPNDLLTFEAASFGAPRTAQSPPLPCHGQAVYELQGGPNLFAYAVACPGLPVAAYGEPQVRFDKARHLLQSPNYRYQFNPGNYMQFDAIKFRNARGTWTEVASDSRLLIRADIKNFFTMTFDSHEIESHLEESRLGPVGNLARLSFFLKVLFFKIRMSLATDVGFFADAGHIPMMVDLPVNAYDRLNPNSGILYSWRLSREALASIHDVRMPILNSALVKRGYQELAALGLSYCNGDDCLFRYSVDLHGQLLSMDLGLKRSLVSKGFFPIFVDDVKAASEVMDWDVDQDEEGRRSGMYFEVSGLPEGGHPWDFWMRLGGGDGDVKGCPRPVTVRSVK